MGFTLTKVHDYQVVKGTGEVRLMKENIYVRLKEGLDNPPLFVQNGIVYGEGGDQISEVPSWFWVQAQRVGEVVAKQSGLDKLLEAYEGRNAPVPQVEEVIAKKVEVKMWHCEACKEDMKASVKGLHSRSHKHKNNVAALQQK